MTLSQNVAPQLDQLEAKIRKKLQPDIDALEREKKTLEDKYEKVENKVLSTVTTLQQKLNNNQQNIQTFVTEVRKENPKIEGYFFRSEKPQDYNNRIEDILKTDTRYLQLIQVCDEIKRELNLVQSKQYKLEEEKHEKLNEIDKNKTELKKKHDEQVNHSIAEHRKTLDDEQKQLNQEISDLQMKRKKIITDIEQLKKPVIFENIPPHEFPSDQEKLKDKIDKIHTLECENHKLEKGVSEMKKKIEDFLGSSDQSFKEAFSNAFFSLNKAAATYKCAGYQWQKTKELIIKKQAEMKDNLGAANDSKLETWAQHLLESATRCKNLLDTKFLIQ